MKQYFETMTDLALDPFVESDEVISQRYQLSAAELARLRCEPNVEERQAIAGKDWASCETCWDPGPNPDPFDSMGDARH